jgi:putative membrane protein
MSLVQSAQFYLWLKAFHVIAVIAWMAGMLYLPRLFVYHCETEAGTAESERFKVMEKKLLRVIINPALIAVWFLGISLALISHAYTERWLQLKFVAVLAMSALHGLFARWVKDFARDANTRSQRFYRMINEVPTALLVAIVILAIVKPF